MKMNMKCPECRGANMRLMELDNDLRKVIRQVESGRRAPQAITDSKVTRFEALTQIDRHMQAEHETVAA